VSDDSPLRRFGFQVREARRGLRLTFAQAAARSGHSEDFLRGVENGREDISMQDADSLVRALGTRISLDLG
jgi:hypothetical protein